VVLASCGRARGPAAVLVGAVAALLAVGCLAACAGAPRTASESAGGASPAGTRAPDDASFTVPPVSRSNAVAPGSYAPEPIDTALAESMAGIDPGVVIDAHVGAAPTGQTAGTYLYEQIALPRTTDNGEAIPLMWEAELVEGATAERTAHDGWLLHAVRGFVETGRKPDGQVVSLDMDGVGNIPSGQQFTGGSDDSITSWATALLEKYGVTPVSVRVLHPLSPAVMIIGQVSSDALSNGQLIGLTTDLGLGKCCEGTYLELQTPDGQAQVRLADSRRSGSGTFWPRPGVTLNIGVGHA
jgi:hypothetical protein